MSDDLELVMDLPPEYVEYHDEGCELFPSCLSCPLSLCRYDEKLGESRFSKRLRNAEIVSLRRSEGKGVAELAEKYNVSRRTVQRILRKAGT